MQKVSIQRVVVDMRATWYFRGVFLCFVGHSHDFNMCMLLNAATTTELSEKKTSVKMRTASGWDEGVDEVTTIVIGEPDQTENWAKALEQPDSGRWSFTNVIVYVFIAIICIIVAAVGVMLVTGMLKSSI